MRLLEVAFKNFMPYKGEQRISFPEPSQNNVILIFGDNMRGKTSFLNAIRWCFYGKAYGRHLKDIEAISIINIDAVKEKDWFVSVCIIFEHNGHKYDLRREMKPKHLISTPKASYDLEQSVSLRKDGRVLRNDEIPHELNQIIPEDIARFFLFDGELLQEYEMLLDNQDEQGQLIKESIEKVLGVPALINARDEIETLLGKARKQHAKETRNIVGLETQSKELQRAQSERDTLESDLKDLQLQYDTNQQEADELDKAIENSQAVLIGKDKLEAYEEEIKRLEDKQNTLQEEKLYLLKDAWKDLIQKRLRSHIDALESKKLAFTEKHSQKMAIEKSIKDLEFIMGKSECPTCEQLIPATRKENAQKKLAHLRNEIQAFNDNFNQIGDITNTITKLTAIKSVGAVDRILMIDKELRLISLDITKYENDAEKIKEELKGHDTSEIRRKRDKFNNIQRLIGRLEDNIKDRKQKIEENERKQEHLTNCIGMNEEASIQKSTRLVSTYTQLKEIFSESINTLRESLRQNVANLATDTFKKLTTEKTYSALKININYGLTIVDREGRDVAQRSAGAEQIVALSLIDGLNRTARKAGPIIMDTPLGRLDLKHREQVLRFLPDIAEQVVLLVHEGEIRKNEIIDSLKTRIGAVYNIERISSSESKIIKE